MGLSRLTKGLSRPQGLLFRAAVLLAAFGIGGCSTGQIEAPAPRPIIVSSGERLRADTARIDSIFAWLTIQTRKIQEDPTFLIAETPTARETLPWKTLTLIGDTAKIQYDRAHPDITTAYDVYAHLHLMKKMGRLDEWLPEQADAEGYELERAIVDRMADAWLLGRTSFDAPPYAPLDELIYAREAGYLDAYLLVGRAEEFPEDKAAWEQANPGKLDEYRVWFTKVFRRVPPGMQQATATVDPGR